MIVGRANRETNKKQKTHTHTSGLGVGRLLAAAPSGPALLDQLVVLRGDRPSN